MTTFLLVWEKNCSNFVTSLNRIKSDTVDLFNLECHTILMKYLMMILAMGLMGCGKGYQDPAVQSIVDSFVQDAAAHGKQVQVNSTIVFGDTTTAGGELNAKGVCDYGPNGGTITLDSAYWNQSSALMKKMILYHELGHCILNRHNHNDATISAPALFGGTFQVPVSIVNSGFVSDADVTQAGLDDPNYYDKLLDELFNPSADYQI